jgi:hypothetical protein
MQDIEKEEEERKEYFENKPTEQEIETHFEHESRENQGVFKVFDFEIFDEFLRYLSNTLFYRTKPYSIVYNSHPINLIRISDFFDHWNNRLLECGNCKEIIAEVSKDIDMHHQRIEKEESEHKERMTDLKFSILTIFISVTLSAVVAALLHG